MARWKSGGMAHWMSAMLVPGLLCSAMAAGAHVHGLAQLDVAVEPGRVMLVLHGAGDNFVGFEHAAQTPEQVAAVQQAEARLQALDELLVIGTECVRASVAVRLPENLRAAHEGVVPDAEDHDAEAHDHSHDHQHEHAHEGHEGSAAKHHPSDWWIEATFTCSGDTAGLTLQARPLFDVFPRLQELQVQAVGAGGQAGATLKPDVSTLALP